MLRCAAGRLGRGARAVLAGALFLGLGERAFELLEGKLELVGMELLGLLPVQRPAQLVQQMFETAVAIAQRRDPRREAPQEPLAVLRTTPARAVQAILDRPCLCSSP